MAASAPSALTLIQQTRRYLRDWKSFDSLTLSMASSSSTTTALVADNTIYAKRWPVEIDQELMMVTALAGTTSLTVSRAQMGSTLASHANGNSILIRPDYFSVEILDAVNEAILACFPAIYKPVISTTQTIATDTYSYAIPDSPGYSGYPWPFVYSVEILQPGDSTFRPTDRFEIVRGASISGSSVTASSSSVSPAIKFKSLPPVSSTLRLRGYAPHAPLANMGDTLDSLFPPQAWYLLPVYAAGSLLMSGEAGRVRVDTNAVDQREQANRTGSSMQVGMALLQRFQRELTQGSASSAMPPLSRHVQRTI